MIPMDLERIFHVGQVLLDCACSWLAATPAGCPDRRCLVPGVEIAAEDCCDQGGQLSVNVVNVFPSTVFPIPDAGSPSNCDVPYDVVSYNIQVLRCSPVGNEHQAPNCNDLSDAALRTMVDLNTVRNAVRCCLKDQESVSPIAGNGYRWTFGDHLTVGPEGACAGSNLLVLVGLPTCWECP